MNNEIILMPGMLSQEELNFCKRHDWGKNAILEYGVVKNLTDLAVDSTGETRTEHKEFTHMDELMIWAGY